MRTPKLMLMDLVLGLERFRGRYEAIDVFADDVSEAHSAEPVAGLRALDAERLRFRYTVPEEKPHAGHSYDVELFPDAGVVCMSRVTQAPPAPPVAVGEVLTGQHATDAVNSARRHRGEGAAEDLVLGLLVGAVLGTSTTPNAPRRVFTLRFDASLREWRAYDGGLVPWMKEHLLPPTA